MATAAIAPDAAAETCTKPPPSKGDSIHMIGCLTDNRDKPPSPVADVAVTVEDESGKVVGKDTSDEQGVFDVTLPGTSVDNLGKSFTIKIDTETLPKGTSLVDEKKTSLTSRITTDADIFVTFPIGEESAAGAGKVTQFLQLAVGGITFSLLLALAALGLSLIFGTTGLTNFAHGELVTFGAHRGTRRGPAAGDDPHRRVEHHRDHCRDRGVRRLRVVRLGAGQGHVEPVAQAQHRPGRDDDHHDRPVDLPAQPLPVLHRRRQLQLLPVHDRRPVLRRVRC